MLLHGRIFITVLSFFFSLRHQKVFFYFSLFYYSGVRSIMTIVMVVFSVALVYLIAKLRQCGQTSSRKFKGIDPIKSRTLVRIHSYWYYSIGGGLEIRLISRHGIMVNIRHIA